MWSDVFFSSPVFSAPSISMRAMNQLPFKRDILALATDVFYILLFFDFSHTLSTGQWWAWVALGVSHCLVVHLSILHGKRERRRQMVGECERDASKSEIKWSFILCRYLRAYPRQSAIVLTVESGTRFWHGTLNTTFNKLLAHQIPDIHYSLFALVY